MCSPVYLSDIQRHTTCVVTIAFCPSREVGDAALPGGVVRRADSVYVSTSTRAIATRLLSEVNELRGRLIEHRCDPITANLNVIACPLDED